MRKALGSLALVASLAFAVSAAAQEIGQMGVFYANVGWIGAGAAKAAGDEIVDNVNTFLDPAVYDLNGIADWVEAGTGDGDIDCLVLFGYTPETIYEPGNGEPDGSLVEDFIYDGNFVINSADYIFYVTLGGGANAAAGVNNIMNAPFDLWTDGNLVEPNADGEKYLPSMDAFTSNRSFKLTQIDANSDWEIEGIFAEGPLGADPIVLKEVDSGGRVGIWMQVSNDGLNRGEVAVELFNNWIPDVITLAVDPQGKTSTTWGHLKADK